MSAEHIPAEKDELFLVDGSGYIFRAYFALPQNLTNPQGQPVGAVLGFCNMMLKLIKDMNAPYIAVIFDAAKQNFRYDIYDQYKANRTDPPEDLIPQFPMFRDATRAFGIPALEVEGYEADDVIAAYAKTAREKGMKVTIIGSDKDLMQLINEDVRLYDPIKQRYIDDAAVMEKFGVLPGKMIDLQALCGDSIDNVPGVPGIGPKTAAQLLEEFGSLDNLLANLDQIKQPKRRAVLEEHAENARMSKRLVTLAADAPVPLAVEDMEVHDTNTPDLQAFLQLQGFRSLLVRLGMGGGDAPAPVKNLTATAKTDYSAPQAAPAASHPPVSASTYTLIHDEETLKRFIAQAYETGFLAIDTETTHLTPAKAELVGICLSAKIGEAAYLPLAHKTAPGDLLSSLSPPGRGQGEGNAASALSPSSGLRPPSPQGEKDQMDKEKAIEMLRPVLTDPSILKIGHNMKYDWQIMAAAGIEMAPLDDTMIMSFVLDGTGHGHGMDALSEYLLGHKTIKFEEVAGKGKNQVTFDYVPLDKALAYAAEDADVTLRFHDLLKPRVIAEKMAVVYEDIERPLIEVIAGMERTGIRVDPLKLKQMSEDFSKELLVLEHQIHEKAGENFNIASPRQIGVILFEKLGLPGGKKTATGEWSTDVSVLEKLAENGADIATLILEHRHLSKLRSTYTDALQEQIHKDTGRVHTSFSMIGAATGRLSSTDPNLQNIPIRSERGRKIREAFIASEGCTLLSVDYSQIELRLAAEMAGISGLKEAFQKGEDIHAMTASQVFNIPLDQMTPDIRRNAKAINFGIIYGISGWGLAKQLGIGADEANQFIRAYLARYPELQDYMERTKEYARKHGYVKTLYGRKCFTPYINDKNPMRRQGAERAAINAPLQGTAADIIKMAMVKLWHAQQTGEVGGTKMLLQVHDELVFDVPLDEVEQRQQQIKTIMENVVQLGVPLEAEAGHGPSWAAAH